MKKIEHAKSEGESLSQENERLKSKLSGRAEQIVEQQREDRWQRVVESLALATEHAERVQDENDRLRQLVDEFDARVSKLCEGPVERARERESTHLRALFCRSKRVSARKKSSRQNATGCSYGKESLRSLKSTADIDVIALVLTE